jgi:hypothetical protein
VWSPNARLSGLYVESGLEQTDDGDAQFFLFTARLALCPVSLTEASLSVRPCLELDLGQLEGRGEDTINAQDPSLLWAAVGPALHLEVALGRSVALEGQLGTRALAKPGSQFLFLPK